MRKLTQPVYLSVIPRSRFTIVLLLLLCCVPTKPLLCQSAPRGASSPRGAEDQFIRDFLALSPQQRVHQWLDVHEGNSKKRTAADSLLAIEDALVIKGLDTVPILAALVPDDDADFTSRWYALGMLCRMDRFVARENLPLPGLGDSVSIVPLDLGGRLNPIMLVDGRRIGEQGMRAVQWAIDQEGNQGLRFLGRLCSGTLQRDLRRLPLNEQISKWREGVIETRGVRSQDVSPGVHPLWTYLENAIVERGEEALPQLLRLLQSDSNPYVREELITMFEQIDSHVIRLRKIALGREAISAIQLALETGNMRPYYRSATQRRERWQRLSGVMQHDLVNLDPNSEAALFAMAFRQFYGDDATVAGNDYKKRPAARTEYRRLVSHLSDLDPTFPGWEYVYLDFFPKDQVFHPDFQKKAMRYHQVWKTVIGGGSVDRERCDSTHFDPTDSM